MSYTTPIDIVVSLIIVVVVVVVSVVVDTDKDEEKFKPLISILYKVDAYRTQICVYHHRTLLI